LARVALVQFGGDQKNAVERHWVVSLDHQGDHTILPLKHCPALAWLLTDVPGCISTVGFYLNLVEIEKKKLPGDICCLCRAWFL